MALDRTKRLPPLEKMIGGQRKPAKPMTAEEVEDAFAGWAQTFH